MDMECGVSLYLVTSQLVFAHSGRLGLASAGESLSFIGNVLVIVQIGSVLVQPVAMSGHGRVLTEHKFVQLLMKQAIQSWPTLLHIGPGLLTLSDARCLVCPRLGRRLALF